MALSTPTKNHVFRACITNIGEPQKAKSLRSWLRAKEINLEGTTQSGILTPGFPLKEA